MYGIRLGVDEGSIYEKLVGRYIWGITEVPLGSSVGGTFGFIGYEYL